MDTPSASPLLIVADAEAATAARVIFAHRYEVIAASDVTDYAGMLRRRVLLWGVNGACEHAARDLALEVKQVNSDLGPREMVDMAWPEFLQWVKPLTRILPKNDLSPANDEPPPIQGEPIWESAADAPEPVEPPKRKRARTGADGSSAPVPGGLFPWEGRIWASRLIVTDKGSPKPCLANVITALGNDPEWRDVLAHDVFALRTYATALPPFEGGKPGPWTDVHDIQTTEWLQRVGLMVSVGIAQQAVEVVAHQREIHPVREYLEECARTWDGQARAEHWIADYCEATDHPYVRAIAKAFLVGAVARIFKPGCKLDTALIFEGRQGVGKSTAFAVLGGEWFSDDMSDLGTKDSKQEMQGAWIMELAELSAMTRSEIETNKAFISRRSDRFRPAYGHRVVECPRQAVFCGTINHTTDYLKDDENRRFWPVKVGQVNSEALAGVRDQLWGEAVHLYRGGARWWLEGEEMLEVAVRQQEARRQADAWEEPIAAWLTSSGAEEVSSFQVLTLALGIDKSRISVADQMRVGRTFARWRWEKTRRRVNGMLTYLFKRPTEAHHPGG